jgi:saccharopine dehydrogenase-like NADP-dependent oxidoreductase
MVYRDGEYVACEPLSEFEDYRFSPPLGLLPMHLSLHSEIATLPVTFRDKGVKECFFKINYWGMAPETVEKIRVLADFGFAGREPVGVKGQSVVPHDLLVAMMSGYVPPVTDFLAPPKNQPTDWVKEIVTEVRGVKDGKELTHRLGALTCTEALPTGVAPARAAIWLAEGRIPPGVYPPEAVLDPEPFFKELAQREIYARVGVTEFL